MASKRETVIIRFEMLVNTFVQLQYSENILNILCFQTRSNFSEKSVACGQIQI